MAWLFWLYWEFWPGVRGGKPAACATVAQSARLRWQAGGIALASRRLALQMDGRPADPTMLGFDDGEYLVNGRILPPFGIQDAVVKFTYPL